MSINRPKRVTYRSSRESSSLDQQPKDAKPADWAAAMEGKSDGDFVAYAVKTTYVVGALIKHPKFGNGIVVGVEAQKIDVLFESGERKLAHAL